MLAGLLLVLASCEPVDDELVDDCAVAGSSWQPGETAFRDATAAWGLDAIGARAVRVSALDFDQDGWTDLLVRNGGGPDQYAEGGSRNRWLLRNTGKGVFEDVTQASGLFRARLDARWGGRPAELVAAGDVDNDGIVDIFTAKALTDVEDPAQETSEVMLGTGDGTFALGPEDSDSRNGGHPVIPNGIALVDADLDGYLDIWMSNNKRGQDNSPLQDRLYRGLGDGSFVDGTGSLGLESERWTNIDTLNEAGGHTWGWGSTACDLNNDGLPELMSASYGRAPNHLWQGRWDDGAVSFQNRSVASGYAYDHRDDWTTNINAQCYCQDHPEAEDCDLAPAPDFDCSRLAAAFGPNYRWGHGGDREPWRLAGNSATTTCADVDNDGWFDLLTGEIVHWDVGDSSDPAELLFNSGESDVRFDRPGNEAVGLVRELPDTGWDNGDMNNAIFDFDNDGWKDVYISSSDYPGTRGHLFHQVGPRRFEYVDADDGIDQLRSAGVTAADFDRDGDLDVAVGHSRFRCGGSWGDDCYETTRLRLFENLHDGSNHWLQLQLQGASGSNRSAIGARVTIERCGLVWSQQVDGGHGHQATQEDPVLHFGLADQDEVEVSVHWPDADQTTETFTVSADARYHVTQGEGPVLVDR